MRLFFCAMIVILFAGCTSGQAPAPSLQPPNVAVASATPNAYAERLEWAGSGERTRLVIEPLTEHTTAILEAAMNATSNYEDIVPEPWTSKSGEEFICKMRFWRTASHDWTYIVDLCFNKNGVLDKQATREKSFGTVHVIHYDDEKSTTESVVTADYSFENLKFAYISTEGGRTCYVENCDPNYKVTTIKDIKDIELQAVEQLQKAVESLPNR